MNYFFAFVIFINVSFAIIENFLSYSGAQSLAIFTINTFKAFFIVYSPPYSINSLFLYEYLLVKTSIYFVIFFEVE